MTSFIYNGTVASSISDLTNKTVKNGNHTYNANIINAPINWIGPNIPVALQGRSWENLVGGSNGNLYDWKYQLAFVITGSQQAFLNTPTASVAFGNYGTSFTADTSGDSTEGTYNVNTTKNPVDLEINYSSRDLELSIRNTSRGSRGRPSGPQYDAEDFVLVATVLFTLTINCGGPNLGLPICFQICENCTEGSCPCFDAYTDYCLNPYGIFTPPITWSKTCQEFVSNYISDVGPNAVIDQGLSTYCQNKYKGFGDLFNNNPNEIDIELCACHMEESEYQNFADQIDKDYPGLGNLGINDQCLVPFCASTAYKSVTRGARCAVPNCLVITSFNNSGTFDNSTVNVNTNIPGCADINGGNTPSNNTDRKYFFIIGVIVIILFVIFIIYLITRNKK